MKLTSLKWLWCYVLILTIGTVSAYSAKQAFVRGLLVAGIGVNAVPAMIFGLDVVPTCNAVIFLGTCVDLCFHQWHPARAGVAVGTASVLAALFLSDKLEQYQKEKAERERKLRY